MTRWQDVDFEQALSVLHGWLHKVVYVQVENPSGPIHVMGVVGELTADNGMAEPIDEEEFPFAVGNTGDLSVSRSYFVGACLDAEGEHLHIELGGESDHTVVLAIELHESS